MVGVVAVAFGLLKDTLFPLFQLCFYLFSRDLFCQLVLERLTLLNAAHCSCLSL